RDTGLSHRLGGLDRFPLCDPAEAKAALRQFHTIALDAEKSDFESIALGAYGLDLNRLSWRLRRGDDRLRREVEGNAEDVGVLYVEESFIRSFFVQLIGLTA